ncbi:MAG TPA: efflux RND transporter periplasmic adaptor subunit [Burkholderiales bacterium]|nr:efflux RND transporter periplasmic adaptor subunit [Burkholderiales bacterium]
MDRTNEKLLAPAGKTSIRARFKRRSRIARSAIALAVALALGGGAYYGYTAWTASAESAARYTTAVVQRGDLEDSVTATGILQPRDYVDVGTQVSGQIKKLHVEVGAVVKEGQLLAEIDPTVYTTRVDADRAQLRTQEAQLADKQSQLALAEQQYQRQMNLQKENATTQDAVDTAAAALRSAKAQIDVLKAQAEQTRSTLRGDEANLNYTKIYAPMSGTVVSQAAKQGQTLNANQQAPIVLRIADLSTMTVQSQVSEADVSKLKVGMEVYFTTLGSQTKRWYGKLRQIEPTPVTVNNVVLYNALFDVENPDRALMTQMTAQVFFVTAQAKDAVFVPVSALRPVRRAQASGENRKAPEGASAVSGAATKGGGQGRGAGDSRGSDVDPRTRFANGRAMVRVVKADGQIEEREVQVGVMSRISAQIVAGLEPGEQVVSGSATPRPANGTAQTGNNNARRMQPRI